MGKVASAKQTGQGGTSYEDKVNAYFMACMLSETPPFNKDYGLIQRIDFQVRPDGWLFDDTLLTMRSNGLEKRIAVSSKSGNQFTSNGCPDAINRLLWEQFLHEGDATAFDVTTDYLCKVEPPLSRQVSRDLNTMLNQAYEQDANTIHNRNGVENYNSRGIRKIYDSFHCPQELAEKRGVAKEETGNLLKCFIHYEMDFEAANSVSEQAAIKLCQSILKTKEFDIAVNLFKALAALPRELAPVGGYLNKEKLVQQLRQQFELENFPSHQSDWRILEAYTATKLSLIPETIGGRISLKRNAYAQASLACFQTNKTLFITGVSGSGKTVVAKRLAEKLISTHRVIWFDSGDFELLPVETTLKLQHTLFELIKSSTSASSCLFIDAPEKLYSESQQVRFIMLLKAILDNIETGWKLVITTTSDGYTNLLMLLNKYNIHIGSPGELSIADIDEDDAELIGNKFPALLPLLYNRKIRSVLTNLKLLDKVARLPSQSAYQDKEFIGETTFIDYFWQSEIESSENGFQKAMFLKKLAEGQADSLALTTSLATFSIAEAEPLSALVKSALVGSVNERLFFNHDLYGDWARYRLLVSASENLSEFLKTKHLASPLWGRALRLYGIWLLEQSLEGESWEMLIEENNIQSSANTLIQDILFESLLFANNAGEYLEKHKPFLFKNEGEYLHRLLQLFLTRLTTPNPEIIRLAQDAGISANHALSIDRIPLYAHWGDMLIFLHNNIDAVLSLGWKYIAAIPNVWLKKTPRDYPFRNEAVAINFKIVSEIINTGGYFDEKLETPVFESLLMGFPENSETTRLLCLQLCRRIKINSGTNVTENKPVEKTVPGIVDRLGYKKLEASQWPDGPYESVDRTFQAICLETNFLLTIIKLNPALATEILLAVLIDEPRDRYLGTSTGRDNYYLHEPMQWYPPFYLRGPFLNFFHLCPEEAIRFTVKITDFATARWVEEDKERTGIEQSVTVPYRKISKTYFGDESVFGWHKGCGNAPHSLVSLLMAFEQFLYEEIEKNKPIDKYVGLAIASTDSLAITGLLLVVAKIAPSLYVTELKHLLPVAAFYKWDLHTQYNDIFSMWHDIPKAWVKEAELWKNRRHRFFPLKDAVLNHFFVEEELQKIFVPIRELWKGELKKTADEGHEDIYLLQMIPQFDITNFDLKEKDGGFEVVYHEPAEVKEKLENGRKQSIETLNDGHFAFLCQQMLGNDNSITLDKAEEIWSKITQWIKDLTESDNDNGHALLLWASPYTNIFAGMAVLLHNMEAWVTTHPEYYEEIKQFSLSVIEKQVSQHQDFPPHGTFSDWNHFLAVIAPVLWKEEISNENIWKLVAGVCILFNNSTVSKLLSETSKHFSWHSNPFIQLQNLFVLHCVEQYKFYERRQDDKTSLYEARAKLIEQFSAKGMSVDFIPLSSVRSAEKWVRKETRGWRTSGEEDLIRRPGIDTRLLKEMLASMPDINDINDSLERKHIITLLDEFLKQIIYELGDIKPHSQVADNYHDEFHQLVIQKIAAILPLIKEGEEPGRFWKPLFEYGYIAPKLIERFCTFLYLKNIEKKDRHDRMIEIIRGMLTYTAEAPTWKIKHINRHEDFRLCIMGMQPSLLKIWDDDLTAFTTKAQEDYKKWFLKHHLNHHVVMALLDFCTRKSGDFIFKEALMIFRMFFGLGEIIQQQPPREGFVHVGHPEHDDKLPFALSHIWEKQKRQLKKDTSLFNLFKDLVQYSVSKNHPVAIALQAKLITE